MKRISLLSVLFTALTLVGCSTAGGARDEYFGYSNEARDKEEQKKQQNEPPAIVQQSVPEPEQPDTQAENTDSDNSSQAGYTMANNRDNPFAIQNTGNIYIENYYAGDGDVEYVPVVVPWWERYYDPYIYHYHHYRPHVIVTWGYYDTWCYDSWWYSPRYYHHPCYGWSYHPPVVYPPVVHYPPHEYHDDRPSTRRDFGAQRTSTADNATAPAGGRSRLSSSPSGATIEPSREPSSQSSQSATGGRNRGRTTTPPNVSSEADRQQDHVATQRPDRTDENISNSTTTRPGVTEQQPNSTPVSDSRTQERTRTTTTSRPGVTEQQPNSTPVSDSRTQERTRTTTTTVPAETTEAKASKDTRNRDTESRPAAENRPSGKRSSTTTTRRESRSDSEDNNTTRRRESRSSEPENKRSSSSGSASTSKGSSSSSPAPTTTQRGGRSR